MTSEFDASAATDQAEYRSAAAYQRDRSIRVFVSSTFLDMQAERRILATDVFPALQAKYRERGVEIFEVDLRWGITQEMQDRNEVLPALFAEIDRCRPYFVGLLGDRFGSIPSSETLSDELKYDYPFIATADGMSVTAMEMVYGVLCDNVSAEQAFLFERAPGWDWIAALDENVPVAALQESPSQQTKLAAFKAQLRSAAHVESYHAPDELRERLFAVLDADLERNFPATSTLDAFQQDEAIHRAYARERTSLYIGADAELAQLDDWMAEANAAPILITGLAGAGKSAFVANWLERRRALHPNDMIFEHYLGASAGSGEPARILRRLWEHLNRYSTHHEDAPPADTRMDDLAAALAARLARAALEAERNGAQVLIALDGLDKLTARADLSWLPIVPKVRLLCSTLDGETKESAVRYEFSNFDIGPLTKPEQRALVDGVLARWRRKLDEHHIGALLEPTHSDLATSPLYLRTVLEELRVSADFASLTRRLASYVNATDLADLFDRVLARLEADCPPHLVGESMALMWASRAGLEEEALIAITGATKLSWSMVRNSLGELLRAQLGRLALNHDYFSQAVRARYVSDAAAERRARLSIAQYFDARAPDQRQAEELPFQLRSLEAWDRLEAFLLDLSRFDFLAVRGEREILSYWLPLQARGREPEPLLCQAFARFAGASEVWSHSEIDLAYEIGVLLDFAGALGADRMRLGEDLVQASKRVLGPTHHATLVSVNNLGKATLARGKLATGIELMKEALEGLALSSEDDREGYLVAKNNFISAIRKSGKLAEAHALQEEVLAEMRVILGEEHSATIACATNLAEILHARGKLKDAHELLEKTLAHADKSRDLEFEHAFRLMGELASTLFDIGETAQAQALQDKLVERAQSLLGAEHPLTIANVANRALTSLALGDIHEASKTLESILDVCLRRMGAEHPDTLLSMTNLADALRADGQLARSESLNEAALATAERVLGADHADTLRFKSNLALTLWEHGQYQRARSLQEDVLASQRRLLGDEHPSTLKSLNNLALTLQAADCADEALKHLELVLEIQSRVLGREHRDTLLTLSNLGTALSEIGRFSQAQQHLERAVRLSTDELGGDHVFTLACMSNLAFALRAQGEERGTALEEHVLSERIRILGEDHRDTIQSLCNWSAVLSDRGEHPTAERLLEQALKASRRVFGEEHPHTLTLTSNLATTACARGDLASGQVLLENVLTARSKRLGPGHSDTLHTMLLLAQISRLSGALESAADLSERALAAIAHKFGPTHAHTLDAERERALTLMVKGDLAQSQHLFEHVYTNRKQQHGAEHVDTIEALSHLASACYQRREFEEARRMQERVLRSCKQVLGAGHPATLQSAQQLSRTLFELEGFVTAQKILRRARNAAIRSLGAEHPLTLGCTALLAASHFKLGELNKAEEMLTDLVERQVRVLGEEHPETKETRFGLSVVRRKHEPDHP